MDSRHLALVVDVFHIGTVMITFLGSACVLESVAVLQSMTFFWWVCRAGPRCKDISFSTIPHLAAIGWLLFQPMTALRNFYRVKCHYAFIVGCC